MIVNVGLGTAWQEEIVSDFKVLPQPLFGGIEKDSETIKSGNPTNSRQRFEPPTSRIRSRGTPRRLVL